MSLRVAFMGNPEYGGPLLEALLREDVEVVAVFHFDRSLRQRIRRFYRRYLRTKKARRELFPRLRAKFETLGDEVRPLPPFGGDVIPIAMQRGIPLFPGAFVHSPRCARELRSLEVDVLLVATFSEILPRSILGAPNLAAINMHPSLLPAYRGGFPEFCAIYDGQKTSGITFHLMEERFDAGNILCQREIDIADTDTTLDLKRGLLALASETIPDLIRQIRQGLLIGVPQDPAKRSYTRLRPNFDHIHDGMTATEVQRLISACHDVEDIGRPRFERNGHTIFPLSWADHGLCFEASDGPVYFDIVRYRHRLLSGQELSDLSESLS